MRSSNGRLPQNRQSIQRRSNLAKHGLAGSSFQVFLEGHLRSGALIVADNADHCPEYVAHVRRPEAGYLSVPISGNVEVSIRSQL